MDASRPRAQVELLGEQIDPILGSSHVSGGFSPLYEHPMHMIHSVPFA